MTEKEREELIEKMANAMFASKQYNGCFALMDMARAALAVAEPVIREQCADIALREENARLREAVKAAYYEGWQDNASIDDSEDGLPEWEYSKAYAAICEGGNRDE